MPSHLSNFRLQRPCLICKILLWSFILVFFLAHQLGIAFASEPARTFNIRELKLVERLQFVSPAIELREIK
jgi:hypothetical protein